MRLAPAPLVCLSLLSLLGCGSSESAVSIYLKLEANLSGTLATTGLLDSGSVGPVEGASAGVDWKDSVQLVFDAGEFSDVNALALADIEFSARNTGDGLSWLRVVVPLGPDARWPGVLTVTDPKRRQELTNMMGTAAVGSSFHLIVRTPTPVLTVRQQFPMAGVTANHEEHRAELDIPLEALAWEGDDLVWHVTW